jgi:hypothetical protein
VYTILYWTLRSCVCMNCRGSLAGDECKLGGGGSLRGSRVCMKEV